MIQMDQSIRRFLKPWVVLIMGMLIAGCYAYCDKQIAVALYRIDLATQMPILHAVTFLGNAALYFVTLFIVACIAHGISCAQNISSRKSRFSWVLPNLHSVPDARVFFLIITVSFNALICGVLKCLLGRARPMLWIEQQQFGFYGFKINPDYWSFPSGHTTMIMSLALGLTVLFPRYTKAFLFLAVCIVASRVLLLQHYVSDVLATSLLVLVEIGFLLGFLREKKWLAAAWPVQPTKRGKTK